MKSYQVYSLGPGGTISGNRSIEALTDEEAIFAARAMQRPMVTEVWIGDRRVGRIPAHNQNRG